MMALISDFKKVSINELQSIIEIEERLYPIDKFTKEQYRRWIFSNNSDLFYIPENSTNKIIGYGQVVYKKGCKTGHIVGITVDTPFQGLGYGKFLLNICEMYGINKRCNTLKLEVRCDNKVAIGLYEKCGYKFIKDVLNYYSDGVTGKIYKKVL